MLTKLLNKLGYYKISQLRVGGMCGACGKSTPKKIYFYDNSDSWCDCGLCEDCKTIK